MKYFFFILGLLIGFVALPGSVKPKSGSLFPDIKKIFCNVLRPILQILKLDLLIGFVCDLDGNNIMSEMMDNPMKVKYDLYGRSCHEEIKCIKESKTATCFNPTLPTVIYCPGFLSSFQMQWDKNVTEKILLIDDCNVILPDYQVMFDDLNYMGAEEHSKVAGKQIGQFIISLVKHRNANLNNFHLIGFSLGGHAASFACKYVKSQNLIVGQLTGLDPAGPGFQGKCPSQRFDVGDAVFVQAIHANAACHAFGYRGTIGNVDIFVNGGESQPGCDGLPFPSDGSNGQDLKGLPDKPGLQELPSIPIIKTVCSHTRVLALFFESIDNTKCKFIAISCHSYEAFKNGECSQQNSNFIEMGYHSKMIDVPPKTMFFVDTNDEEPYCRHTYNPELIGTTRRPSAYKDNVELKPCPDMPFEIDSVEIF